MLFIISIVLAVIFSFACGKPLKKHPVPFYITAVIISAVMAFMNFRGVTPWVNTYILGQFTRGSFATALWAVVMWTGAFPNGSRPVKALMPVRGELSIFAAILTLGHNIGYGKTYLVRLFTEPSKLSGVHFTAAVLTVIMLVIMIPLTVLSFKRIRKKMKASLWKKIQRTAYLFYALMYIHVMVLFVPMAQAGRKGYLTSVLVYSLVFISYAVCRVRKAYYQSCRKNNREYSRKLVDGLFSTAFIAAMIVPCICASPSSAEENLSVPESTAPAVTLAEQVNTETATPVTVSETEVSHSVSTSAVSSVSETAVSTVSETQESVSETVTDENQTENEADKPQENPENNNQENSSQDQPAEVPEVQYIYNNGTYTSSAYGYDGDVTVTITIENDVITSISGSTSESDPSYFADAKDYVFGQILGTSNSYVNAYSGCTYSSNAIMSAVAQAMNSARR